MAGEEQKTQDGRSSPQINPDIWKLMSRVSYDNDVMIQTEVNHIGGDSGSMAVIQRDTVFHQGIPVSVATLVVDGWKVLLHKKKADDPREKGRWLYSRTRL